MSYFLCSMFPNYVGYVKLASNVFNYMMGIIWLGRGGEGGGGEGGEGGGGEGEL